MNKYLFLVEVYPEDYIDVDTYALELEMQPTSKMMLEEKAQNKIIEDKNLFTKLIEDYKKNHWEYYKNCILEEEPNIDINQLKREFDNSLYVYTIIVNPNDGEMIDTWKSLPKISI